MLFKGHFLSKYMFYVLTGVTILRSLVHIVAMDGGAQSVATIPINTYSPPASNTVVFMFAYWGLSQLLFALFMLLVGWKYRALIPLMYLFCVNEYLGRLYLQFFKTRPTTVGTAPGAVANYVAPFLLLILFFCSIYQQTESPKEQNHRKRR